MPDVPSKFVSRNALRTVIAIAVLFLTVSVFVYYLLHHPEIVRQLKHTPPTTLLLLLVLYFGTVIAVGLTLLATLLLCNLRLTVKEGLLLTMYSTVINFFGPLQSGPVFRAVYLKRKHKLKLKNYSLATFVYYGFYAVFSGLFLLSGLLKWWLLVGLFIIVVAVLGLLWKHYLRHTLNQLNFKALALLGAATLLQVTLLAIIYYVEVHTVDPSVKPEQVVIYTGAANFALFVALTPGAIGFREAFLVFSRRLHHISVATIVAANVIDRCVYIVLLMILVLYIFLTHVRDQLQTKTDNDIPDEP